MADYRRKKFYIDKIFQSKFLFLFLFLSFLGALGNVFYLSLHLKKEVESNLFRHRFVISNVNEIIVNNVFAFNVVLLALITLFTIAFYFLVKRRIKYFVGRLENALYARKRKGIYLQDSFDSDLPKQFQDINDVLAGFFKVIHKRRQAEEKAIISLKKFSAFPDEKTKHEALARLSSCI